MAVSTAFMGMRGTGDWATEQRPTSYREGILVLYPNGMAPITAMQTKFAKESVDDPKFTWFSKLLPSQGGAMEAGLSVYTNVALSSLYAAATAAAAGTVVYVKPYMTTGGTAADANKAVAEFRVGHEVRFVDSDQDGVDVVGKVVDKLSNGLSGYVAVKLLEADNKVGSGATYCLATCDQLLIIGNINAEGGYAPDAIGYDPVSYYNYTQIFRAALSITRTARKTRLRTGDAYKEMKREALELISIEMEKSTIWGIKTESIGDNGKYERTTEGLVPFIRNNAPDNVSSYLTSTDYAGKTWLQGGESWLDERMEYHFRYGSNEKLVYCGSGALLGINKLAKAAAQISVGVRDASYGLKVIDWVTPFGIAHLRTHPLFSYNTSTYNSMLILEPKNMKYRYVDDVKFQPAIQEESTSKKGGKDATDEEFLGECGYEFHHALTFGWLTGVGKDNIV